MRQISRRWALWFLLFAFSVIGLRPACAQAVTILHSFGDGSVANDGATPVAPLLLGSDGNFYGTTEYGGTANGGTAFTMTPGGTETVLFNFGDGLFNLDTNPVASLVFGPDGNLYGTTAAGGTTKLTDPSSVGYGAVFQLTTAGQITTIHDFSDGSVAGDGKNPFAALTLGSDGNYYGTTEYGGSFNGGTVFTITPGGATTILHSFGDGSVANDGLSPVTSLLRAGDGNFYGTTKQGGSQNFGTIFKITPAGAVTIMHSFGDGSVANDGQSPVAALIQGRDGNFYGTTQYGGAITAGATSGSGTVFKTTPQGAVTILHSFGDGTVPNDALLPEAALLQGPDGNFYGTSEGGGFAAAGALFEITPAGTVTILHSFGDGSIVNDGFFPQVSLVQGGDDNLYGATTEGGVSDTGTIFQFIPAPPQNDDLAGSIPVIAGPANPATTTGTNFGATAEPAEPLNTSSGAGSGGHSVWWNWTAPVSGTATITTIGSTFDTTLGVYTGSSIPDLTLVAANDDISSTDHQSSVLFNAVAGTTYQIDVDGYFTAEGSVTLNVSEAVPAPANDNFVNAIAVTALPGTHVTTIGTNFGATAEPGEPANTSASGKHSVWWTWTASGTGTATIDTFGSSFDTTLGIYKGGAVNALTQVIANDDAGGTNQSQVIFSAVAGTKYSISVDGFANHEGNIVLSLAQSVPAPPNDNFAGRFTINAAPGAPGTATGNNSGATQESGETLNTSLSGGHSIWWKWTASVSGSVTIDTLGSSYDTTLGVHTGSAVNSLTQVAANDDISSSVHQSSVTFSAVAGTTYQISVDGHGSSQGSVTLHVTQTYPAPTITSFTPASGPIGASVVLTGTHFTGATSVKFHGTAAAFSVNSDTKITATVPPGTTTGTVAVSNPSATATSAASFTVTLSAPAITGFTPASGPIGTTVTITGTNLIGTTVVGFQGKHALSFTVNGAGTQIITTVPAGAVTGPIALATPGGTVHTSVNFTVTAGAPIPLITSFSPGSGRVGTIVTINGASLTGATVVGFQGKHAVSFTVNGAGTQITTMVPSGAVTGPIAVATPGGTAHSSTNFTVTP